MTISAECFEHNPLWRETFSNMYRMTKKGGVLIITCASTGRIEHGTARSVKSTDSPGTTAVGWDYDMNLTQNDFDRALDISRSSAMITSIVSTLLTIIFLRKKARRGRPRFQRRSHQARRRWSGEHPEKECRSFRSRAPLGIMSRILSERQFQNIAVPYTKALYRIADDVKMDLQAQPLTAAPWN